MEEDQDIDQTNSEQGSIEVFSFTGESVFQKNIVLNRTKVDLFKLPVGAYILKVKLGSQVRTW